jgi:hypothetical protein
MTTMVDEYVGALVGFIGGTGYGTCMSCNTMVG